MSVGTKTWGVYTSSPSKKARSKTARDMRAAASGVGGAVGNVTISNDSSGITGGAAASSQENWIAGGFALGALLCFYAYFSELFETKSFRSLRLSSDQVGT